MTADTLHIIAFTVIVALGATIVMVPPGVAVAWVLARGDFRGKSIVETLFTLPLVVPPVATGYLLLRFFSRRGPVGDLLDRLGLEVVFTWRAVLIAMAVMGLPLVVRTARAGFEERSRRFEQMAETLGASPWRVFATVSLPLAARPILAGALLGFSRALGEFGATIVLAGNIPGRTRTIAVAMFSDLETGRDSHAWALLGASLVIAWAAVSAANRLDRIPRPRANRAREEAPGPRAA
jgi:molybdate transport system permease protein